MFGNGAVTVDSKSHVCYHEDYHLELDSPWVYWPDLSQREMWILSDEELEGRVQRSCEPCWIVAENLIW